MLPADVKEQLDAYVSDGQPMGSFLQAVLENKLVESFGQADMENQRAMFYIVQYVYERVPMAARGSAKAYFDWIDAKARARELPKMAAALENKIHLCFVDLDTIDPDRVDFQEYLTTSGIKVVGPLDAVSAFPCIRYIGSREALEALIDSWFADPDLYEHIHILK